MNAKTLMGLNPKKGMLVVCFCHFLKTYPYSTLGHEENDEESSQAGYDDESESSQAGYDDESSSDDEKNEPIWFPVLDGDSFSSVTTRTLK